MPIYEYQCADCQSIFEEWQSGFEDREMECPECGGQSKRLISNSSFHLKGGGWYADGYGEKKSDSTSGETKSPAKSDSNCSAKSDSGGADAAPAAKPASDSTSAGSAS